VAGLPTKDYMPNMRAEEAFYIVTFFSMATFFLVLIGLVGLII